jgi:hypothetical protein
MTQLCAVGYVLAGKGATVKPAPFWMSVFDLPNGLRFHVVSPT